MVGDDTRRGVKRKRKKRPPFGGGRKSGRVSHDDRPPRGVWLSEDVQNYFSRVLEVERQGFDSHEDRVCFARNVFEEMVGKEVEYSCSGLVSRVTEALVPASDDATLARTCDAFAQQLPLACTDPCASHVAQALLLESADRVGTRAGVESDARRGDGTINGAPSFQVRRGAEGSEALAEFVLSVGRFLVADLDRFVWHRYANHIARSCLAALTGVECGTNGRQKPQGGQRNKVR
ncbi:hypothetical protein AAG570_007385 [Ranatra chinensis]|uniref:Uncharacterized protein n=1 Tax=Ranatra chinensis TaxID=642074 RepID=A0ABD0YJH4_9HEMI